MITANEAAALAALTAYHPGRPALTWAPGAIEAMTRALDAAIPLLTDAGQPLGAIEARAGYSEGFEAGRTAGYRSGYDQGQMAEAIGPRDEMGTPLRPEQADGAATAQAIARELLPRFEALEKLLLQVRGHLDSSGTPQPGTVARRLDDIEDALSETVDVEPTEYEIWRDALTLAAKSFPADVLNDAERRELIERAEWFDMNLRIPPGEGDPGVRESRRAEACECGAPAGSHLGDCPDALKVNLVSATGNGWIAKDEHVHHVPGEDEQTAALRDMVNENRQALGIDPAPEGRHIPKGFRTEDYAGQHAQIRYELDPADQIGGVAPPAISPLTTGSAPADFDG
jgi:hypothetical protein